MCNEFIFDSECDMAISTAISLIKKKNHSFSLI